MAVGPASRIAAIMRQVVSDHLYRGSLLLLTNTAVLSVFGFAFWTFAARRYSPAALGTFSAITSGVGLLSAVAALGLPNTMIRQIASSRNQRELVMVAALAIAAIGGAMCLVTVLLLGPLLPAGLHLRQRGGFVLLVTLLVIFSALGTVFDAGLVALRSTHAVLIKNVAGSITKIAALLMLAALSSTGLVLAYGAGLVLASVLSGLALTVRLKGSRMRLSSFRLVQRHLSMTASNYAATIMGILPVTVVPLEVLSLRGAEQTARFAIAFMLAGFLNVIPSTTAQVLFAEASRGGLPLGRQLRKALRGVYGLLLPSVGLLVAAAPLALRIFGSGYVAGATGPLRVLALTTLVTAGNYLVDSLLIARDRATAYVFMNGVNAALVLGFVAALLPRGLTAGAGGWALGQALSLVIGLLVLATGHTGRHHMASAYPRGVTASNSSDPTARDEAFPVNADPEIEPRLQELLAAWPTMPTTLIAEQIGWDRSMQTLLDRVAEVRSLYLGADYPPPKRSRPGEIAQCGLWFAPTEVPTGFGQVRRAKELPVLTMITGYSRWLSAVLIPTTEPGDLFAGWWQLLEKLGAIPQVLVWNGEGSIGQRVKEETIVTQECQKFARAIGSRVVLNDPSEFEAAGLIERAHAYLERSFVAHRSFTSPVDFNTQLAEWVEDTNTRHRHPPRSSPQKYVATDQHAMRPLPEVPPVTGWRGSARLSRGQYLRFDSNHYSVHPDAMGCLVDLFADLRRVQVVYEGRIVANHQRVWAHHQTITDPAHRVPPTFMDQTGLPEGHSGIDPV